jgi:CBS domain-containing protein
MNRRVRDVMRTSPLITASPDDTLAELERALMQLKVTGMPVVERGKVVGVVSRSDIVRQISYGRALAEIGVDYYQDLVGIGAVPARTEAAELAGRIVADRLESTRVRDVMSERVIAVAPAEPISAAARAMVERGIHRVLVLDEGSLVGILTSLDLVALLID